MRRSKERRRTQRLAAAVALIGGALAVMAVRGLGDAVPWPALAAAFVLGGAVLGLPIVLHARTIHRIEGVSAQQRALINLRPLSGTLPVVLENWAIDPCFGELLLRLLIRERPGLVLECGSGSSTVITAAVLRELGAGRVVSLEHEARFVERTREMLRQRGLEGWADVVHAPIQERDVHGRPMPWYGGFGARIHGPVDLLVVDGPPKRTGRRARYPAVPLLRPHLAANALVLLDDGERRAERRMARDWARLLDGSLEYVPLVRGAWVIRCGAAEPLGDAFAPGSPLVPSAPPARASRSEAEPGTGVAVAGDLDSVTGGRG